MVEVPRRGILAVAGVWTTGCLRTGDTENDGVGSSTAQTKTSQPTASMTDNLTPAERVSDIEAKYARDWARISTKIIQASLVDDEPAEVQITVSNNSMEERRVRGDLENPTPLQCDSGPAGPGLVLVPPRAIVDRADSDCWVYSDLEWEQQVGSGVAKATTISPGESVSISWEIWWTESIESDICMPSGEYVFSRIFQRRPQESDLEISVKLSD